MDLSNLSQASIALTHNAVTWVPDVQKCFLGLPTHFTHAIFAAKMFKWAAATTTACSQKDIDSFYMINFSLSRLYSLN